MVRRTQAANLALDPASGNTIAGRAAPMLSLVDPAPPGDRAVQLFRDARVLSLDHLALVAAAIATLRGLLDAVAGDLYVAGARELAERISEDLFWKAKSLELITQRQRDAMPGPG